MYAAQTGIYESQSEKSAVWIGTMIHKSKRMLHKSKSMSHKKDSMLHKSKYR
ncbi:hypothetical protein B4102_2245 [Heyndrickxia sporothermodurans]|uniref:Uncharacterized protein n=1 Tax=Heyndrickxia sporothermodurans TaxID=46224 RepID=A0A150LGD5_9BACI|nr:hypothetical protein B4102_2245 [Heyndrickxia sporothermodurans]